MKGWFNIQKSISMIHYASKLKTNKQTNKQKKQKQIPMIISLDSEKAFDKIQHAFMLKVLERSGIQVRT